MKPILYSSVPHRPAPRPDQTVNYTMWETSRIPPAGPGICNQLRALIVPSAENERWFRESGVTAPIRVVPLAIDVAVYRPGDRFESPRPAGPVRFGCAGRTAHGGIRKGLDLVIRAFLDAFSSGDGRATLDVKCWPDCNVFEPDDHRVRIIRDPLSDAGLAGWYRSLDVFCSASRGEGWGLQPHQAMACGTPALAPWWGGHLGYMTPETSYPVDFDERPAEGDIYGGLGEWCVIRHDSMVAQMRAIVGDLDDTRARGIKAATRAAEFTWERTARGIDDVLVEFAL